MWPFASGSGSVTPLDGFERLCLAVVIQAIKDYRQSRSTVLRAWLEIDGFFIVDSLNVPIREDWWRNYIDAGCPVDLVQNADNEANE